MRNGNSSVVRGPDLWSKGLMFESWQEQWENFLLPCWLLFRYPFHPHVTAVAHKRSWSFCQKYRWQVTAKHTCTLHMWLCIKWRDLVHSCMAYTAECAKTAAVPLGTSHVTTMQRSKGITLMYIQIRAIKKAAVTHSESHATWAHWEQRIVLYNVCLFFNDKIINKLINCLI